jgi:hypothetical protein
MSAADPRRDALATRLAQSKEAVRLLIAGATRDRALMIECVRLVDDLDEVEALLDTGDHAIEALASGERLLVFAERKLAMLQPRAQRNSA